MADFNAPWWVAGGRALDLWMERETRPHQDVDIAILRGDQQKLYRSLSRWELYYATPDHKLLPLSPERWLRPPIHGVWARWAHDAPWLCEFLLNEHTDSDWMYREDPAVRMPLADIGSQPRTTYRSRYRRLSCYTRPMSERRKMRLTSERRFPIYRPLPRAGCCMRLTSRHRAIRG